MTKAENRWLQSRSRLVSAVRALGYPEEFAALLAKQLGSPRAIDRMTSYLTGVRPRSLEMIVDEMLAICTDADAWREKKASREAEAAYSAWLNSDDRLQDENESPF